MDHIEEIKTKLDIVSHIEHTVTLKKAGRNFKGLCPFHNEKSPSFTVSSERQVWHCFGCGKGGDIFSFLMELEHITFGEALGILAAEAGVKIENRAFDSKEEQTKSILKEIHHLTAEYYHFILTKHALGVQARAYLENRGIPERLQETFFLGYAPEGWHNISRFLVKKGYSQDMIVTAGLAVRGKNGIYDRFRGRIMFPLRTHRGETIAFAGRVLTKTNEGAKYINSPETPLYTKGHTLYDLSVTKDAIRTLGTAVLVEGEFDVISSYQSGVSNVVAVKGSAITEQQVLLLKRFAEHVIFALDRDSAGIEAARRGAAIADSVGLTVLVAVVPEGKDPDEAARSNPVAWKKAVAEAVPYYDFLLSSLSGEFDPKTAHGKKKIAEKLLPVYSRITNSIVQAHYLKKLSDHIGIGEDKLYQLVKKQSTPAQEKPKLVKTENRETLEEYLLSFVVHSQQGSMTLSTLFEYLDISDIESDPVKKIIQHASAYLREHTVFDVREFSKTLPQELVSTFDTAYLRDIGESSRDSATYEREFLRTILQLKRMGIRRKLQILSTKLKQETEDSDPEELKKLNEELTKLARELKLLPKS